MLRPLALRKGSPSGDPCHKEGAAYIVLFLLVIYSVTLM